MSDALAQEVISIIAASRRIPVEQVTLDTKLEQLGVDSLELVEIVFLCTSGDRTGGIKTVRDAVEFVKLLSSARSNSVYGGRGGCL